MFCPIISTKAGALIRSSEDFDHSTRKFDPFTCRADQGRGDATKFAGPTSVLANDLQTVIRR